MLRFPRGFLPTRFASLCLLFVYASDPAGFLLVLLRFALTTLWRCFGSFLLSVGSASLCFDFSSVSRRFPLASCWIASRRFGVSLGSLRFPLDSCWFCFASR